MFSTSKKPNKAGAVSEHGLTIVPELHIWRWASACVVLILVLLFVHMLATNENMQWPTIAAYMFDPRILAGVVKTLELTATAIIVGLALGLLIAIMRMSQNPVMKYVSVVWIWVFRGVPPLVQLLIWYNAASLIETISIGIPFGPKLVTWETNEIMQPFVAAILGLALTESGYAAEIFRSGIEAVSGGLREAAASLGFRNAQTMRRIVLPQALRIVIPPIGNQLISMLKFSSLVSVLALPELLYSAQQIYSYTFETIPLLMVATFWYMILATILTVSQSILERRLDDVG